MSSSSFSLQIGCSSGGCGRLQPRHRTCAPRWTPSGRISRLQSIFGGNKDDVPANDGSKPANPFANFSEILKTAKDAQAKAGVEAAKAQEELSGTLYEGYDTDETVKVVVSGNQEPRDIEITEAAIRQGTDVLSARVVEAMRDAHHKSVLGMKDRMKRLYEELGFPMPPQDM